MDVSPSTGDALTRNDCAMTVAAAPSLLARHAHLLTVLWTAFGSAICLLAPRLSPGLLALSVAAPLVWAWSERGHISWRAPSAVVKALGLAGVYLLINASWSLSPADAYAGASLFLLIVAVLHVTLCALGGVNVAGLRAMALGFAIGTAVGCAVLCFEVFSQQWAHRFAMSYVPRLRIAPQRMQIDAGWVTYIVPYLLNRSMTMLALFFWPAVLVVNWLDLPQLQRRLLVAGLALAVPTIFWSDHETSKLAFLAATVIYAIARFFPLLANRLTITAWMIATLLVVPLTVLGYNARLYQMDWLPMSARHRIVIWGYTSEQFTKAPWLGIGISGGRALHDPNETNVPRAPGSQFARATALHSHNAYLQVWYETGAVGALFLLGIGLLVLRRMAESSLPVRTYLYATFVTCAVLAASSFSIWASWFMSALALTSIFVMLGIELSLRQEATGEPVCSATP